MFFIRSEEQYKRIFFCALLCAGILFSFFLCGTPLRSSIMVQTGDQGINSIVFLQEDFPFSPGLRCPGSQVLSLLLRQRSSRFTAEKRKRSHWTDQFLHDTTKIKPDILIVKYRQTTTPFFLLAAGLFQTNSNAPVRAGPSFPYAAF